jgi:hypothetical protein
MQHLLLSTETIVTLTRLIITLYVQCIACRFDVSQWMVFRTFIAAYSANHFKKQALTPCELLSFVTLIKMVYMITTVLRKVVWEM